MSELLALRAFQREITRQCEYAVNSLDLLNQAHALKNPDDDKRIWFALQSFLIAAGNISKLLWPRPGKGDPTARKRRNALRRRLRSSLGVPENSVLKLSPEFRNHWEHLDERIEEWVEDSTQHNLADHNFGPPGAAFMGIDAEDEFRSYDRKSHVLGFRGETFAMDPLVEAILALHPIAKRESEKRHWRPAEETSSKGGGQ